MAKGRIEQEIALTVTGLDDVKEIDKKIEGLQKKKAKIELDVDDKGASKKLDKIDEQIDALKKRKAEIEVTADTETAARDLKQIFEITDKLGSTSANIVLRDNAKAIESEIADLVIELDKLSDPEEIRVKMDEINKLETELGQVDTKLRELGERPIDIQTGNTRKNLDDIGKSADSSKSVLANMVGNATQDLGALGGIAGSAGVAIGQMGEYMVDAAADGDKLGRLLVNFGKVAGPIGLVALATQAVSEVMKGIDFSKTFKADNIEAVTAAIRAGESQIVEINNELRETGKLEADVAGGGFAGLGRQARDVLPDMQALNISVDEFNQLASTTDPGPLQALRAEYGRLVNIGPQATDAQTELAQHMQYVIKAAEDQRDATEGANDEIARVADVTKPSTQAVSDAVDAWKRLQDPVSAMPEEFHRVADALGKGVVPNAEDVDAIMDKTGMTFNQVFDAASKLAEGNKDVAKSQEELRKKTIEAQKALDDQAVALDQTQAAVADLASAFSQMDIKTDALTRVFDLGNAPEKAAGEVRDIALAIGDLPEALKGIDAGDVLAGSVKADKFLDAIDALVPEVQAKVTEAFSTGGPEAATAMANSYIDQVTKELGGKFTREQVAKMLGLEDIEATVAVALKLSTVENARRQLQLLTGLGGETPWTASIALALDAGTIDPATALLMIQAKLRTLGVDIPTALTPPGSESVTQAIDDAQRVVDDNPVVVPFEANSSPAQTAVDLWTKTVAKTEAQAAFDADPTDADKAVDLWNKTVAANEAQAKFDADPANAYREVDGWVRSAIATHASSVLNATATPAYGVLDGWEANANATRATATVTAQAQTGQAARDINALTVTRYVDVVLQVAKKLFANGGTVGPDGGIAGEAGPEFVDGTLVTGPTPVAPGSKVTSVRRTRAILTRSATRATTSATAPIVSSIPLVVNVNAAVIGSRYEVAKAVGQGTRDLRRLIGNRGAAA